MPRELENVSLASADEAATFVVESVGTNIFQVDGFGHALAQWGLNDDELEIRRTEHRAPILSYLPRLVAEYAFAVGQHWPLGRLGICRSH